MFDKCIQEIEEGVANIIGSIRVWSVKKKLFNLFKNTFSTKSAHGFE